MTSSIIYLTWWFASCSEVWETCMLVCITQRLTLFTNIRTFSEATGKFIIWKFGGLFPFLSKNYLPSIDSMLAATGRIPAFHQQWNSLAPAEFSGLLSPVIWKSFRPQSSMKCFPSVMKRRSVPIASTVKGKNKYKNNLKRRCYNFSR